MHVNLLGLLLVDMDGSGGLILPKQGTKGQLWKQFFCLPLLGVARMHEVLTNLGQSAIRGNQLEH